MPPFPIYASISPISLTSIKFSKKGYKASALSDRFGYTLLMRCRKSSAFRT